MSVSSSFITKPSAQQILPLLMAAAFVTAIVVGSKEIFYNSLPGRDQAVFLYTGNRILRGELPYLHVWDHKLPLIYYINALGLAIGAGSRAGLVIVEATMLYLAILLGFMVMRSAFNRKVAIVGSLLWIVSLTFLIYEGNMPEQYSIPLQFFAMYLVLKSQGSIKPGSSFIVGVSGGLAFLLKPNVLALWIGIGIFVIIEIVRGKRAAILALFAMAAGALSALVPFFLYFYIIGVIDDFMSQAFTFNAVYINSGLSDRWYAIGRGVLHLSMTGLYPLACAGWLLASIRPRYRYRLPSGAQVLLAVNLYTFPVMMLVAFAGGRALRHYYIAWLPSLVILAAFAVYVRFALLQQPTASSTLLPGQVAVKKQRYRHVLALTNLIAVGALVAFVGQPLKQQDSPTFLDQSVAYIQQHTKPDDYVLVWGNEAVLYYLSARQAPTRYIYQYALYTPGYSQPAMIEEFLSQLQKHPPALIIDASKTDPVALPFALVDAGQIKTPNSQLEPIYTYIATNYELDQRLNVRPWHILTRSR